LLFVILPNPQTRLKKFIIPLNLQTLLTVTKVRRLEWLGYVATMDGERTERSYWKANQEEEEK